MRDTEQDHSRSGGGATGWHSQAQTAAVAATASEANLGCASDDPLWPHCLVFENFQAEGEEIQLGCKQPKSIT